MCLERGVALDSACFHAQQAAEKYLKAYLVSARSAYPPIHNVEKLIELCAQSEPSFVTIRHLGALLTPYAVAMRYDDDFWPSEEVAREAYDAALTIKRLVLDRLPHQLRDEPR